MVRRSSVTSGVSTSGGQITEMSIPFGLYSSRSEPASPTMPNLEAEYAE
jgi:hypothetical protein